MENEVKSKTFGEEMIIKDLVEKKIGGYYGNNQDDNFVIPRELTVTITLREYRDLICAKALADHNLGEIKGEKWKLEDELKTIKKKYDELSHRFLDLEAKSSGQKTEDVSDKEE